MTSLSDHFSKFVDGNAIQSKGNDPTSKFFEMIPAAERETRRTRKQRQLEDAIAKAAAEGREATLHEKLGKKRLRHAVDAHEEEDKRTVFVANLPNKVHRKHVARFFEDCGEVENARIRCQVLEAPKDGKDRGRAVRVLRKEFKKDDEDRLCATAYVLFKDISSVPRAVAKSGMVFKGRHITVTEETAAAKAYDPKLSAFLGNLTPDTSDEDIWQFFINNGVKDLKRVRVVRDRDSGKARGFAYVEFATPASCAAGIALRGNELNGRPLRAVHANKSSDPAIARLRAGRRQQRADLQKKALAQAPGPLKHGEARKMPPKTDQNLSSKPKTEVQPWMGMMTNPRRKLDKELRGLIPSNVVLSKEKKKAIAKRRAALENSKYKRKAKKE